MIVNKRESGLEIIFQRAHAMLAAQIAYHWKSDDRPARWVETLLAVAGHDDAQKDFKARFHLSKEGRPKDFTEKKINLHQPKNNAEYSFQKSRWIGLLNSMHISYLYESKKGQSDAMDEILEKQSTIQRELQQSLKIDTKQADEAYRMLEWCDALSLILCRGDFKDEVEEYEVSKWSKGLPIKLRRLSKENAFTVIPWTFESDDFEVSVESRILPQFTFSDDKELEDKLKAAEVIEKTWRFINTN